MPLHADDLPDDVAELKRLLISKTLETEKLKFELAKLKRMAFGQSSERIDRAIAQLELRLEEIETSAAETTPAIEPEPSAQPSEVVAKKPRRKLPEHLARLKITLDDVDPPVLRRIEVPMGIRLDRLHAVLQSALGWTNSHLWEIRARDTRWGPKDPYGGFGDGPLDASKATLLSVVEDMGVKSLKYLYDFGDGWEHTIRIERVLDAEPGARYPRLLEAIGRCPPEDIGGPPGYAEFLEAIADPKHERHDEVTEFYDADLDPNAIDLAAIDAEIKALARRWSRPKAPAKRKSI